MINKFTNPKFGQLTTITNSKTGVVMFLGKEISKKWGHTNLTQAIKNAHLNKNEYLIVKLSQYPNFKNDLCKSGLATPKTPTITMVTESGMYKLVLSSNFSEAKPFRDWVTEEVLPSIRKNGYYSFANQTQKLLIHTEPSIQKQNSKDVNRKNFEEGGIDAVIEYNRQSSLLHTGKLPHEWLEEGKKVGLKSKERTSGKEVIRHLKPEVACGMSFTDDMVKKGFDLKTVSELTNKAAIPLFKGMLELGATPAELNE